MVKRFIRALVILIVIIFTCSILLEILLRLSKPSLLRNYALSPLIYQPHDILGYTYAPSSEGVLFREGNFRVEIKINSHGFYDDEFMLEKPEDTIRILTIGDSFTSNLHASRNKTYSNVLETLLNSSELCECEVYNLGVSGYGTNREREMLEEIGLTFNPDIVIHQIYENDINNDRYPKYFMDVYRDYLISYIDEETHQQGIENIDDFLGNPINRFLIWGIRESYVMRIFYNIWLLADVKTDIPLNRNRHRAFTYAELPVATVEGGIQTIKDNIQHMNTLCAENGCVYILLVIPTLYETTNNPDSYYATPILNFVNEQNIPYLDMRPQLTDAVDQGKIIYWIDDSHHNELGYEIIASSLKDFLTTGDYLERK